MENEKNNYVYILNCSDNTLYTGWTTDIDRRFKEHNKGKGAKYTRARLPVQLIYYEQFQTKQEAMKREYAIKQLRRKQKLEIIRQGKGLNTLHTRYLKERLLMYDVHIMLVEDEERIRKLVAKYLKMEGYKVCEAEDGERAIELFEINNIDLIILDVMMPEIDGWSVCRKIRKQSNVPIIMLTARDAEDDKIFGFELGVDQYVTKPFSSKELVARVKALLKKNLKSDDQINIGDLVIDFKSHDVTKEGVSLELSPKEFDLLIYFIHNKKAALTRDMILDRVWGYDYYGEARTVDTHIKRLRKKIIESSVIISTVRGVGYKLEVRQ